MAKFISFIKLLEESKAETRLIFYDVANACFASWYPVFWRAAMKGREECKMNVGHINVLRRRVPSDRKTMNEVDEYGMSALH